MPELIQPHLLDLFCGRGGWTRPAIARGWRCTGIDITDHGYPGTLITSPLPWDTARIMALAPTLVVASPPCEDYARFHLPWLNGPPPDETLLRWAIALAAELPIPCVVECSRFAARHVRGASFTGSYALWGTVPTLLPVVPRCKMKTCGTDPARRAMIHPELATFILSLHEG